MSDHPKDVNGMTMKELAEKVGNLQYDFLRDFLRLLALKLHDDARDDSNRGRTFLSVWLRDASKSLYSTAWQVDHAWDVCKKFMEGKDESTPARIPRSNGDH